jgi:predicted MFS family arabinose efflux permease
LLLAAYGIAGLTAMGLLARPGDRRPKAAIVGCLAGLTLVFALLAGLGFAGRSTAATLLIGIVAVVAWGATATAVPPMLQSAAMRHCPEDPDGASGLYVAAFQIGIMAGSLVGGLLFERTGEAVMLAASGLLVAGALTCVLLSRDLFAVEGVTSRE